MAYSSSLAPLFPSLTSSPSSLASRTHNSHFAIRRARPSVVAASASDNDLSSEKPTKLVSFLGKGGSGKTTAAIFAAQHYAMAGLSTCLVIHSQDPTAEFLLNCKIGTSPTICNKNLSAVRLETTKMLLEPLHRMKEADARLKMTQGVLEGVVGEELGVLPGMDSIFSAYTLERLVGLFGNVVRRTRQKDKYDVIIYDGMSTEETLRIIGASSRARLYLKYLRNIAEKTDFGRLAGPSLLRLVGEALNISSAVPQLNGKMSAELWDTLERALERGSSAFVEPLKFGCYLVMNPNSPTSLRSALRYWGCAIQAGALVSGAFALASSQSCEELTEKVRKDFSPMPSACIPHLPVDYTLDWNAIVSNVLCEDARDLLSVATSWSSSSMSSIKFDRAKKSVTLFMPGFDKSEIKLYQYRGGSELVVEAGDQRRVICLPLEVQGKVGGAKFVDRSLIITMR